MGSVLSRCSVALAGVLVLSTCVQADTGVKEKEILIGSCSALTGPARELGTRQLEGAQAYIKYTNEHGGVNGRKIRLLAFDDGYEPGKAASCFNRLLKEGVFAAAFFVGTPTGAKYASLAEKNALPIVGLFTGAQSLREPVNRYIFNVRASYYDETREQVDHLWKDAGIRKVGVIYQDDAFGLAVLEGVKRALKSHGAEPVAAGAFARNTVAVDEGIKAVRAAGPEAVVIAGPYKPVAEIIRRGKDADWNPLFTTVSFVGTESFIESSGRAGEGTVVTQVVPPVARTDFPAVALYRKLIRRYFPQSLTDFVSLEGFLDAVVLVEGLNRCGKDLTRWRLIDAMESMRGLDIGLGPQVRVNYGPKEHQAFNIIYDTVIRDGQPVIFDDWAELNKELKKRP